jgi:predicted XRE-type DNA-binding protein
MTELKVTEGSSNIFADLGFDVQQSQNLLLRSQTMIALAHWFKASGLTQTEAAKTLGVTQPRFNQLLKGKIEIFSLDALVNMATSAGMRVGLNIRPVSSVRVRSTATAKKSSSSIMAACPTVCYQKSQ